MRPVSQLKVFIAHAAVGIFALAAPAYAGTTFINFDTTITTDITGDQSATTADDQDGDPAGAAALWQGTNVDVIVNAGVTLTGGAGGPGGLDAANDGGNNGGLGSTGAHMWKNGGTLTASGIFVYGGAGGTASDAGTGGVADTTGGVGGAGGDGIHVTLAGNQITLTDTTVQGGKGGNGGNAGNAAGDPIDDKQGGLGGQGGAGIGLDSATDAVITLNNVSVKGGDGAAGGASLVNATNANGGNGGFGFVYYGTNAAITLGTGTTVQGGVGGAAGTGGTGGAAGSDGQGVHYGGLGGSLTNHGTILGGGSATALSIGGTPTAIDNHGTIGAAMTHLGSAVRIESGADIGTFTNHAGGSILSDGSFHATIDVDGTVGSFVNQGTIANSGANVALALFGSVGTISNSGTIHSAGATAIGIGYAGAADTFDNAGGTISSSGVGFSVINIVADLGGSGITFDGGTISHTAGGAALTVSSAQAGAISVRNANVVGSINFTVDNETLSISGTSLNGDVIFTGADNNLNFEQDGTTTIAAGTNFVNTTFFSLLGGANVVSNSEQSAANSDILKLTVVANADLVLNQNFWVDDAVFSQGSIEIAAGKTLSANEFSGDGAYVFDVTDESTVAKIEAHGAFSKVDLTGATIEVKLTNPSTMFASGTNLLLGEDLNGNDVLGVANGAAAADNSALLNFLLYRGDAPEIGLTSDLLFAQVQLALLADIAGEGDDPNSIALGAALDAIGLDGDADIDDLMLALALLPTNEDINEVLDSLLPETDGIAYDIATDMGDQALDVASKRLDTLLAARLANEYRLASLAPIALRGSMNEGASRFWAQAFGRAVDQDRHSYNTGYDATSYGFALGADTHLDKATALGAAFSYTSTDADGNGINRTDTDVDSYQLTLYGDHLFDNAMYAKGLLAYGWHANDIARHDVGGIPGNTATGSYDADHITARAEFGRAYKGGDTLTLIPRAHLNAAWYSPDGYSEQGVGGLGLTVAPDDLTSVRLGVGVLARWDITLSGKELFQPELRLDYRRDLTRERFETTSAFLGAPGITFRTQGVEPAADILNLGVGALLATAGGVDLRASYDVELKEDYTAHAGYLRASIPF